MTPIKTWSALSAFLCHTILPSTAGAAPPPQPSRLPPDAAEYSPAKIAIPKAGITLLDAVKFTLDNDPNIRLQAADAQNRAGRWVEQAGEFDATFSGEAGFEYRQDELRESVKTNERRARQVLDNQIEELEIRGRDLATVIGRITTPGYIDNPRSIDLAAGITDPVLIRSVQAVASQFIILDDLIEQASGIELQRLLETRDSFLRRTLEDYSSDLNETRAGLAEATRVRTARGDQPVDEWTAKGNLNISLSRKLRSGITLRPFFDFTYDATNFVGKEFKDSARGGKGIEDTYKAQVGFDVRVPLLRGRGRDASGAQEAAAGQDAEAGRLQYVHRKSRSVLDTVAAYWDVRAALDELAVAEKSVQQQATLLDSTRQLINASQKPRSDESRAMASWADSKARLEAAGQRVNEAWLGLAKFMGVVLQSPATPSVSDLFPEPAESSVEQAAIDAVIREGLAGRLDLKAAVVTRGASETLTRAARFNRKPILDFEGRAFGTSTGEKRLSDLNRWVFRSGKAAFKLELPFANDLQEGRFLQAEADLDRSGIDAADLERNIALNVARLSRNLKTSADRVREARSAVKYYEQAFSDEQAKFRAGDSTLVDTILTEQQTTSARVASINAQRDYARTLAELRFEAGTLVVDNQAGSRVTQETLTAVPLPLAAKSSRP